MEEDPPTRQLQPSEIDYLRKKLKSRIKTRLTYKVARTFLNKIIENKQLIIKDVIGTEHMDAVSYTHLDVYKRQMSMYRKICVTNRALAERPFLEQLACVLATKPYAMILREKDHTEEAYEELAGK